MSTKIWELPVECLQHILLLTSPEDVLRSSAVSKEWFSVAISDGLWKKFLPSDYDQIIKKSSSPLEFNSLKDLFVLLYRSFLLIDQNTKSISLDKRSWKKCYMLGSRSLAIAWDKTRHWSWICVPESRFPENAKLEDVCWLDIKGAISTKSLSPNTTYGAYFVFKLMSTNYTGFERVPVKLSVSEVNESGQHPIVTNSVYLKPQEASPEGLPRPIERGDGWMEIEMGTYQVGVDDRVRERVFLEMSVRQTEILNWKHNLLIQGIELRPLD